MEWLIIRETLEPNIGDFSQYGNNWLKIDYKEKEKILKNQNYSCRYCGGKYNKYMNIIKDKKDNKVDICCYLCFIVNNLNIGHFKEIKLYISEKIQTEIVQKTVELLLKNNNKIPSPVDIDPNIKIPPISLLEYINILINKKDKQQIKLFNNYKIFFSQKLNIDFLTSNYGTNCRMFVDPEDVFHEEIYSDTIKDDDYLEKEELSNEQDKFLKNIFN